MLTSFTGIQNCFFYIDIAISQRIVKKMKNKRARYAAHAKLIDFFQDKYVTASLLAKILKVGVQIFCHRRHVPRGFWGHAPPENFEKLNVYIENTQKAFLVFF